MFVESLARGAVGLFQPRQLCIESLHDLAIGVGELGQVLLEAFVGSTRR